MSELTKCPVCGTPCEIVGHTTKHYEPIVRPVVGVKWPSRIDCTKHKNTNPASGCSFCMNAETWNKCCDAFMSEIAKQPRLKEIDAVATVELDNIIQCVLNKEFSLDVTLYEVKVMRNEMIKFFSHFGTRVLSEQEIYQAIVDSGHCKNDYDETMAIAKAILTSTRWKVER